MPFAAFLLGMVQPLIARILVVLGLSVVSFTGMGMVMDQVIDYAQSAWQGLPAGILGLAGLAGVGQALGIIMSAILTRVLIWQLSKATRILSANT